MDARAKPGGAGRAKWVGRFHTERELRHLFDHGGFDVVDIVEVLGWKETYSASADWVAMMRHADSMFTALTDDEIAAGLEILRSQPDRMGKLEVTLLTFEHA